VHEPVKDRVGVCGFPDHFVPVLYGQLTGHQGGASLVAILEDLQQFTALGCIACHGTDLSGGIGPELRKRTVEDLPDSRIREQAMQGGNGMPAFPNMTEPELQNFIAFIRSQA